MQQVGNQFVLDTAFTRASSGEVARLKATKAAYNRLRNELAVTNPDQRMATGTVPAEFQEAAVIGRPPQSPYDTLIIDIGSQSDVELEAPVWWPPGVYLGEVINVRERTAVVQLVSSPSVNHQAQISEGVQAELSGQGGGAIQAEVADDVSVATGTQVISDRYGLPVGEVAAVEPVPDIGLTRLHITQLVPMSVVEYVYVGEL